MSKFGLSISPKGLIILIADFYHFGGNKCFERTDEPSDKIYLKRFYVYLAYGFRTEVFTYKITPLPHPPPFRK